MLTALLLHGNVAKAARECNVTARTIFNWLKTPKFERAVREARNRAFDATLSGVCIASVDALQALRDVLSNAQSSANAKIMAARTILEFALRSKEAIETEERLRLLEERLQNATERN